MKYEEIRWQDLPEQLRALTPEEKMLLEAISLWSITFERPVHQVIDTLNHIRTGLKLLQLRLEREQEPSYVADRLLQELTGPS